MMTLFAVYMLTNILLSVVIYSTWNKFTFKSIGAEKIQNLRLGVSIAYLLLGVPLLILGIIKLVLS